MGRHWIMVALLAGLVPGLARGQGVLLVVDPAQSVRLPRPVIVMPYHPHPHPMPPITPPPPPPAIYKISELQIEARLVDQVAKVQVSQAFVNTGSRTLEVSFVFPLPYDGAVEQMTLLVDGKEYPAKLLRADEARRMYEEIVRKNRDPALLEWMGTGLFKTSVFPVPPGAKRTVTLRYAQLCRKVEGLTDFLFPLSTAKYTSHAVEKVSIRVTIDSQTPIKNVYSPTHAVEVKRPDDQHAVLSYTRTNEVPISDFRLFYDVGQEKVSARVISYRPSGDQDGYFVLLASPQIKSQATPQRKTVVFVIDKSGSMSGKKIEQVQSALKFVLNNLREGDLFNIVAYDSAVESFRPELQRYGEDTRKAAMGFVEGLYAGGSTNIKAALQTALSQLQDKKQPSYVVFLTDGLPTAGETNEMKIAAMAKEANQIRARLFVFGVGYDVNSRLLEKLASENRGQSQYVRPDENLEEHVSRFYRRIEAPVMTDVEIQFSLDEKGDAPVVNRVYPKGTVDLFAGQQLVLVGRYKRPGSARVMLTGLVGEERQKLDFPAELVPTSIDQSQAFAEKLWAVRRVGEILEEIDLSGKNQELVNELIELSQRHGILTPYTSFFADDNVSLGDLAGNRERTSRRLEALKDVSGAGGVLQRAGKGMFQHAASASQSAADAMRSFGAPATVPAQGGRLAAGTGPSPGAVAPAEAAEREAQDVASNVRNVGNRAFYRRQGQWIDSRLNEAQQAQARRIKQFSPEYFELARRQGRELSQYLAFDEPVLLDVQGQAYLIEP